MRETPSVLAKPNVEVDAKAGGNPSHSSAFRLLVVYYRQNSHRFGRETASWIVCLRAVEVHAVPRAGGLVFDHHMRYSPSDSRNDASGRAESWAECALIAPGAVAEEPCAASETAWGSVIRAAVDKY